MDFVWTFILGVGGQTFPTYSFSLHHSKTPLLSGILVQERRVRILLSDSFLPLLFSFPHSVRVELAGFSFFSCLAGTAFGIPHILFLGVSFNHGRSPLS